MVFMWEKSTHCEEAIETAAEHWEKHLRIAPVMGGMGLVVQPPVRYYYIFVAHSRPGETVQIRLRAEGSIRIPDG